MTLLSPIWLLLAIPLVLTLKLWPMPTRVLGVMRALVLLLIIAGMVGVAILLPSRAGTVIVVADRSLSMPGDAAASQKETIDIVQSKMGPHDQLGVVSFGRDAVTEQAPQNAKFGGFVHEVGGDASDLHDAIEQALSLIPRDSPGRVLVLSDGRWTGADPTDTAARAAARGIALDYRSLERPAANDLAIASVDAPATVNPREAFMLTAWVHSPTAQTITYELKRGDRIIAEGHRSVPVGLSRLTFRDVVDEPSTAGYTLDVRGENATADPVPENNRARVLVGVTGVKPVLHLTAKADSQLGKLLRTGGLDVQSRLPDQVGWSLADLSNYSAVMIEEVGANDIGLAGMNNLAEWVRQTGAGLMMTGGKTGFGPGGYFKSPLDPILPVSMELRREHRKLSLAIVIALDRSGSMSVPTPSGRPKIELADLAAAQVVQMLTPMDEVGVLAVDSAAHEIVPLKPLDDPARVRDDILRIGSEGGGIFIYEALSHAADMLRKSKAGTRHIILFADANDSEEEGQYRQLLALAKKAGITVSVIGMGTPHDSDSDLLRDIAKRGEGRIFFTENVEELPRLFAQDTFVVARSSFIDDPTPVQITPGLTTLTTQLYPKQPPPVGGYNLTYLRDGANMGMITTDEYKAPVIASWQVGSGRVLCYTGEIDGQFTGPIAGWSKMGDTITGMVRWTAGDHPDLPNNMILTQRQHEGVVDVQLHLDPDRAANQLPAMPSVNVLRGLPGEKPTAHRIDMTWTDPDTLAMRFDLHGSETAIATVDLPKHPPIALPPVTLPYSPEFKPVSADRGPATLHRLAAATGGIDRLDLPAIWSALPQLPRRIDLAPWFFSAALIVLLLEVLERRTGAISMIASPGTRRRRAAAAATIAPDETVAKPRRAKPAKTSDETSAPQPAPAAASSSAKPPHRPVESSAEEPAPSKPAAETSPEPPSTGTVFDALNQARRRAHDRTHRRHDE